MAIIHSLKCTVPFSFHWLYYCCHSLSLIAFCCHSLYYSLSLLVTCCTTRCHSLYHSSLVVICCHSLYHSLSLVVICCHSLSLHVPLFCLFLNDRNRPKYRFTFTLLLVFCKVSILLYSSILNMIIVSVRQ